MFQPGGYHDLDVEQSTGVVLSGTLDGLVDHLIIRPRTNDPQRYNFHEVFWTTCSEFIEHPFHLFQKLSERFGRGRDIAIRSNIVCIMDEWLQQQHFLPNEEDLQQMQVFCDDAISPADGLTCNLIQQLKVRIQSLLQGPGSMPVNVREAVPLPPIFSPHDLAVALTLLEGDNFARIRPYMYVQRHSPIINRICNTNNRIEKWVTWSILDDCDVDIRTDTMTLFIKTALACHQLRNFSSAMAIARALHPLTLRKHEETRHKLSRDKRTKLQRLSKFAGVDGTFLHYQETIRNAYRQGSCIPWLKFHLDELQGISAMYLKKKDGHINFQRYNFLTDYLRRIKPYEIPPNLEYLRNQSKIAFIQDQLDLIDLDKIDGKLEQKWKELERLEIETWKNRLSSLGLDVRSD